MGLGDFVSKILLEVKADTSDAKAKLRDLSAEERKIEKARIEGMEASNKSLDKWVKGLGTLGLALGATKVAFDLAQEYGHKLDLQAAAAGVSIAGLSKASMGLKSNMELLEHAARFNKSAFKLTQEQMETTERAMYALEERGNKSADVWSAVDAALTKGAIKPLEQFGIVIDKTGLQLDENGLKMDTYGQKQEAVRRIMEALSGTAREAEGAQHDAADAMQVEIVKLQNFWDQAKDGLAQLILQLTPLLQGLAAAVKYANDIADKLPKGTLGLGTGGAVKGPNNSVINSDLISKLAGARGDGYFKGDNEQMFDGYKRYTNLLNVIAEKLDYQNKNLIEFSDDILKASPKMSEADILELARQEARHALAPYYAAAEARAEAERLRASAERQGYGADYRKNMPGFGNADAIRGFDLERQNTINENQGRTNEFKSQIPHFAAGQLDEEMKALQKFTDLATSAFESLSMGSMGVTQMLKQMAQQMLLAFGKKELVEAISQTAYGFGALANPLFAGAAALHFKSAAGHAAAAVAAGAGAYAIGAMGNGGGGGNSAGASGGGNARAGGGGSFGGSSRQQPGERIIVVMGDAHSRNSPRMQQLEAERVVDLAYGGTGVTSR